MTAHYSLDKDTGVITLTSAGVTLVDTDNIYADYNYNMLGISESDLQDFLDRAEDFIKDETHNHWADGTDATPNYNQVTNEKHTGQGFYNRHYFAEHYPLPDVSTTLDGDVAEDDTTINVVSTNGFPSSGIIGIGADKIQYTGKTTTAFTGCTSVSAHSDGASVYPFVVEISTTEQGSEPTWQVLDKDSDYDINLETGRIYIYTDETHQSNTLYYVPPVGVPNRVRFSYIWGNDTIPADIKQLTLMVATRDLLHTAVRKAHISGNNGFDPTMINVDESWINKKIESYKNIQSNNTL